MEKEAAKWPLPTAALYGLQNLQRLDNDLSASERHRALGFSSQCHRLLRLLPSKFPVSYSEPGDHMTAGQEVR
jgi:hypothetical protein